MIGVEIDFVVTDSLKALDLYERIFDVERTEVTSNEPGSNEALFTIYGTRFHMLDENPAFQLIAPKEGDPKSMWINVTVPNINEVFAKAMTAGCSEILPITKIESHGVVNAMFADSFGYLWMLHQRVINHQ